MPQISSRWFLWMVSSRGVIWGLIPLTPLFIYACINMLIKSAQTTTHWNNTFFYLQVWDFAINSLSVLQSLDLPSGTAC